MAQTFDLTQEDYATVKLNAGDPFKIKLLKRKDRPQFMDLQKKIQNKEVPEGFDIVEIMKPYVFEDQQEAFVEAAGEFTFYQLEQLSKAFFEMNGLDYQAAKVAAAEKAE